MRPRFLPRLQTERTVLKLLEPRDALMMARFRVENRDHLTRWEPRRSPEFYTAGYWELQLRASIRDFRNGVAVPLVIVDSLESEVLGVCNFTNIVRGTFQSCHLGYALAGRHEGQGLMYEALQPAIAYVFNELHLHRVIANYLPHNERSGRLLEKLGFEIEGRARKLLKINGEWEDHVMTSLINPESC